MREIEHYCSMLDQFNDPFEHCRINGMIVDNYIIWGIDVKSYNETTDEMEWESVRIFYCPYCADLLPPEVG